MATKKKTETKPVESRVDETLIDIDLTPIKKTRFRIDGNNDRILELNIRDMRMPKRLSETLPKIEELSQSWSKVNVDDLDEMAKEIDELDIQLREYIDYIFDSNVSDVTAPNGTMFDMINGKFRCEYILDTLTKLYAETIQEEADKLNAQMLKHTAKYKK